MSNAGYFVGQGLDPSGTGYREFKVSQSQVRHFMRYGPASKFFDSVLIFPILKNPSAIFRGLEREDLENGYCYAGVARISAGGERQDYPAAGRNGFRSICEHTLSGV
jgi:hypothetical protein